MRNDIPNIRQWVHPRLAALAVCLALGCTAGCEKGNQPKSDGSAPDKAAAESESKDKATTGIEVLDRMIAVYQKASSYSDKGIIRLQAKVGERAIDQQSDLSLVMERPNKLLLTAYQTKLACNGKEFQAKIDCIPDQVLVKPAPSILDMRVLLNIDPNFSMYIGDYGGPPPQLFLLFTKDPKDFLLHGAKEPTLIESGKIGENDCYRVRIQRNDSAGIFWIDKKSFILRRIVLPTDEMRRQMSEGGQVEQLTLVADFIDAQFDAKVDADYFQLSVPKTTQVVKYFIPPIPRNC